MFCVLPLHLLLNHAKIVGHRLHFNNMTTTSSTTSWYYFCFMAFVLFVCVLRSASSSVATVSFSFQLLRPRLAWLVSFHRYSQLLMFYVICYMLVFQQFYHTPACFFLSFFKYIFLECKISENCLDSNSVTSEVLCNYNSLDVYFFFIFSNIFLYFF